MDSSDEIIGIIAGNRSLPLEFARQARAQGVRRLVAVAFEGETNPELAALVDDIVWLKVGQLSRMIEAFKERRIQRCVMLGQIAPKNLFDVRPDFRALALLIKLKEKNAQTIFGALADELQQEGITVIEPLRWLGPLMPGTGFALGRKLTPSQQGDVAFGFRIAKELSRLEIGQSVVVRDGVVLAAEAFEGTDRCLKRGGELAGGVGAIAVKVAKEKHDLRFDIPCIGAATIETCHQAGIDVLAFEAGKTLLLEREILEATAKKSGVTVVSWG